MFKIGDRVEHCGTGEKGTVTKGVNKKRLIGTVSVKWDNPRAFNLNFHEPRYLRGITQRKRVYLAGKMQGVPFFNFPAFHKAAARLRREGYYVFNPAEADIDRLGVDPSLDNPTGDVALAAERHGLSRRECLAEDLSWIALNADIVALLPGWRESSGARAEVALAEALGLELRELEG